MMACRSAGAWLYSMLILPARSLGQTSVNDMSKRLRQEEGPVDDPLTWDEWWASRPTPSEPFVPTLSRDDEVVHQHRVDDSIHPRVWIRDTRLVVKRFRDTGRQDEEGRDWKKKFMVEVWVGLALARDAHRIPLAHVVLLRDAWVQQARDGRFLVSTAEYAGGETVDSVWWRARPSCEEMAVVYFTMWFTLVALHETCGFLDDDRHLRNVAIVPATHTHDTHVYVMADGRRVGITPTQHRHRMIKFFDYDNSVVHVSPERDDAKEQVLVSMRQTVKYLEPDDEDNPEHAKHPSFNAFLYFMPKAQYKEQRVALTQLHKFTQGGPLEKWANRRLFNTHLHTVREGEGVVMGSLLPPVEDDDTLESPSTKRPRLSM